MKVLVVDESPERGELLREGLERAGYEVAASLTSALALLRAIDRVSPDIIVIDTESPSRDVLEHLVVLSQHTPRPVVMFATDGAPETIRRAMRAGVSAYIVDGLDPARVKSIVAAAIATFEEFQRLRLQLAERKDVERAKALLMKRHRLDEEAAYSMLRKIAMDRNLRIGEVAQRVIDGA
jgi:two-component system, response regulator / RNA-binding antiterminator